MKVVKRKQSKTHLIWDSYSEGFNQKRIYLEFLFPFFVSLITIIIHCFAYSSIQAILANLKIINYNFFTIIAIQIGFNIASMTLIASFNKVSISNAFSNLKEPTKKEQALKQLLASFTYCILVQTGIIVIGFFYNINIVELININILNLRTNTAQSIIFLILVLWISIIFHSFMVAIRNVVLIFKFILVTFKD